MPKVPRWVSSAVEHETGFIRFLGGKEFGRSGWWRFVALVVVIMMMIGVWSTGYFEVADESVSEHGVKAAVLAIATATMVFVSMIGRGARTRQSIDPWIQLGLGWTPQLGQRRGAAAGGGAAA